MILWRIAAQTRSYAADDLSGLGAARFPGRCNDEGEAVIYCSPTVALAALETAAHIDDAGLPMNRYLVAIEVPDELWKGRIELQPEELQPTWDAIPAGQVSVRAGSDWIRGGQSLILLVPSVIVPEERAALINPSHPAMFRITARVVRSFDYNRLFRR